MPNWYPDWSGEKVAIVASGPSAVEQPIDLLRAHCRVVAINNSWRLAPWADALYACDGAWWLAHGGVPGFHGLKVSLDIKERDSRGSALDMREAAALYPDIRRCPSIRSETMVFDHRGAIGWGGNSGFQAINWCAHLGVSTMVLIGFDMSRDAGSHWHGDHGGRLHNPSVADLDRYRSAVDGASHALQVRGVRVVNVSATSSLRNYEKLTFEEALNL